jgi:hypothetical protein
MVSVLGFAVQGYVTGEGPYANWSKHVADPFGYNLLTVSIECRLLVWQCWPGAGNTTTELLQLE